MMTSTVRTEPRAFTAFYDLWQAARIDGALPLRKDLRLDKFAAYAPNLVIIERTSPGFFTERLVGGAVEDRFGPIESDVNILDYHVPDTRKKILVWLNTLFDHPCGSIGDFSVSYEDGVHRACQAISLPILGTHGQRMLFSFHKVLHIIAVETKPVRARIGGYYSIGQMMDIGFGLPESGSEFVIKPKPENMSIPTS